MNKAFIFDMDGVLVDSERTWAIYENEFFDEIFGPKVASLLGDTTGLGPDLIYEKAVSFGYVHDKNTFLKSLDQKVEIIYKKSNLTENVENLIEELTKMNFKIGIVSASRKNWIQQVLEKFQNPESLSRAEN